MKGIFRGKFVKFWDLFAKHLVQEVLTSTYNLKDVLWIPSCSGFESLKFNGGLMARLENGAV